MSDKEKSKLTRDFNASVYDADFDSSVRAVPKGFYDEGNYQIFINDWKICDNEGEGLDD